MIETVALYLFAIVISSIVAWYVANFKYFYHLRWIPGPTPLPLVGNGHEFTTSEVYFNKLKEYHRKYGKFFKLFLGLKSPTIVTTHRDFYKFIFTSTEHITKAHFYEFMNDWIGKGLVTSTGSRWKWQRKLITPAFHFNILESFLDTFDSKSDILIERLKQHVDGPTFDVEPYFARCSLDIICETSMGLQVNAQKEEHNEYVEKNNEIRRIVVTRLFNPWLQYDFLYTFTNTFQRQKQALKVIKDTSQKIITKRRQEMKANNNIHVENNQDNSNKKKKQILIDVLLNSTLNGRPLTDEEIQEEVDTFVFAGHDTTSTTLAFIIYCLSKHPDIQQRVYEEIRSVLPEKPSSADLQELTYTDAVIKEVMRMYSLGTFIGRQATTDIHFKGNVIPEGTQILFYLQGIQNDPDYFPEPEKFDPDRFYIHGSEVDPFAYVPFSAGPRNCIGQKFGMLELKLILSKFLRHYKVLPAIPEHNIILAAEWVVKTVNGHKIRLTKRES